MTWITLFVFTFNVGNHYVLSEYVSPKEVCQHWFKEEELMDHFEVQTAVNPKTHQYEYRLRQFWCESKDKVHWE